MILDSIYCKIVVTFINISETAKIYLNDDILRSDESCTNIYSPYPRITAIYTGLHQDEIHIAVFLKHCKIKSLQ